MSLSPVARRYRWNANEVKKTQILKTAFSFLGKQHSYLNFLNPHKSHKVTGFRILNLSIFEELFDSRFNLCSALTFIRFFFLARVFLEENIQLQVAKSITLVTEIIDSLLAKD